MCHWKATLCLGIRETVYLHACPDDKCQSYIHFARLGKLDQTHDNPTLSIETPSKLASNLSWPPTPMGLFDSIIVLGSVEGGRCSRIYDLVSHPLRHKPATKFHAKPKIPRDIYLGFQLRKQHRWRHCYAKLAITTLKAEHYRPGRGHVVLCVDAVAVRQDGQNKKEKGVN